MSAFPALQSARLTLREFRPQDAPALFDIYRDAVSMQWFGSEPLQTLAQAEAQVALFIGWQQLPSPWLRWAVAHGPCGTALGISSCQGRCEIASRLPRQPGWP